MKKVLLLACCLFLTGCNSDEVQRLTTKFCGFIPTVETIAAIFLQSGSTANSVGIAQAICNAVTTLPKAQGPNQPVARVGAVIVQGRFVR